MDKHALDPACLLGDRLQTLSRAELTALAEALCRILTERGTYHGGIRPDNISRAADGTVGLGAPARTDTKDWTTEELEYMAPEVFWSGTRDASADVYSLGLLLYAGVSGGRLPFYPDDRAPLPEDHAEALRRRMNGEPLPLARKAGRGLAEIIARAAQCKPDDRYATPAELCAALEQYDAEQRRNVPTAQEMFHKPEQELSEVERMMLAILTEEAAAPVPEAEPEPETPVEEPAAEETPVAQPEPEAEPAAEPAPEKPEPEAAPEAEAEPKASKPEPQPEPAPEVKPEPEPETKPQPAPEQKPAQPLPNKFRPEKQPARPETPAKPQPRPERKPEKPPVKKPEAYRPAPKKREPAEQRQSHKAGILLTVLIICAAVLAVLLLRSLGVFGTPTTAETTPTPTVSVATPAPTETPTPTPTPKPEPTYEVVTADVSWADAEAAAEAKGGHLVVIDSAEKWTRVAQLADESGLTYVWIGLHRTDSGELAWVRDNVDPVYNWASGEPSVHDTNGAAEDYVLITRTSSGWYYNDCIGDPAGRYPQFYSGKIGYIIEIDP
jgi:serine/threonine protein kinase